MRRTACLAAIILSLILATSFARTAPAQGLNVYYILDASGSMWGLLDGVPKIEIAKDILLDRVPSLESRSARVGLVVYGHRSRGDCADIEQLIDLQPAESVDLAAALQKIKPKGKTPIAQSVEFVAEKLRTSEEGAHVILISDGDENCRPDPCAAVAKLREMGVEFTLDVIGFDLTESQHEQLECMAEKGGGEYYSAANASELREAVAEAEKAPPPAKVGQNVQIVLDRSREMTKDFDGRQKIDVAKSGILGKTTAQGAESENLAFRVAGGKCDAKDNTDLIVPFTIGAGPQIALGLEKVELRGVPTLASALLAATEDFDDPDRFADVSNRVVLFTGSKGYCDPNELRNVYDRFREKQIKPDIHFIAMALPPAELDDLKKLVGTTGGRLYPVTTQAEFDKALDTIFDVEPVIAGIKTVTNILNDVIGHLNSAFRNVRDANYGGAKTEADQGRAVIMDTNAAFRDLGKRQSRQTFANLYATARENRQLQSKALELVDDLIDARKKENDASQYNSIIDQVNGLIGRYNQNIHRLDEMLQPL